MSLIGVCLLMLIFYRTVRKKWANERQSTSKSRRALESKHIIQSQGAVASLITLPCLDGIHFSEKANLELDTGSICLGSEREYLFPSTIPKARCQEKTQLPPLSYCILQGWGSQTLKSKTNTNILRQTTQSVFPKMSKKKKSISSGMKREEGGGDST